MANEVRLKVTADTKPAEQSLGGLKGVLQGIGKVAGGVLAADAIKSGLSALVGGVKSAIGAASNLQESMSKVDVVFGDSAQEIKDWAAGSAKAFGQSKQSALEAAGTYGNLFQAFGVGRKEATSMSKSLVELAADLASFNNTSVDDALLALRSGLSGETEPLKRFGIAINDARLKDEALRMGLIKTKNDALDPGAKAQAAYALIMKDSALAQGDFARTSDGLANKQRILSAQIEDVKAKIGTALIPIQLALVSVISQYVLPALEKFGTFLGENLPRAIDALRGPIEAAIGFITELVRLFNLGADGGQIGGELGFLQEAAFKLGETWRTVLKPAIDEVRAAFDLFLLGLKGGDAGGELGKLGQAALEVGQFLAPLFEWFSEQKTALIVALGVAIGTVLVTAFIALGVAAAGAAVGVIAATLPIIAIPAAVALAAAAIYLLVVNFDTLKAKAEEIFNSLPGIVQTALSFIANDIATRVEGMIAVFRSFFDNIVNIVQLVAALFRGDFAGAWDEAKQIVSTTLDGMVGMVRTMFGSLPDIILGFMVDVANAAGQLGQKIYDKVMEWLRKLPGEAANIAAQVASAVASSIPGAGIVSAGVDLLRAHGGPMSSGQSYVVGERGPEVVEGPGMVYPAGQGDRGGGGVSVSVATLNIYNSGAGMDAGSLSDLGYAVQTALASRGIG